MANRGTGASTYSQLFDKFSHIGNMISKYWQYDILHCTAMTFQQIITAPSLDQTQTPKQETPFYENFDKKSVICNICLRSLGK